MAESYSIKAVLSAEDKNFSSIMSGAMGSANNLKSVLIGGLGFGVLTGIGQQAFSAISSGVRGLVGEMSSSSAAWKTFTSNMRMNGKTEQEIKSIKKELQSFAEQTVYSSSDMASTFAQLEAVGTKNTTKLVKGFGGLAAAAENPQQAMKTLSQQATQMAAKPTVAWMDFKLMLEQTPAGISAVAKEMGMTTSELVTNVQDGKVATEDFFDAISRVGTNDAFTKLATEYKTVGQAMDGLKESAANKLQPAFEALSAIGISGISGIADSLSKIDAEGIATKITSAVDKIKPYWDVLKSNAIEVKEAFGDAFSAISSSLGELMGAFGSTQNIESFSDVIGVAKDALVGFAGFMEDHADTIAKVITKLPALLIAYKGFKIVSALAPGMKIFTSALTGLASKGIGAIAGKLTGVAAAEVATGTASATSATQVLAAAVAFIALGAGVALACVGFSLLASAAINLASAGPLAIGVMIGMIAAIAGLAIGASVLGPALTAGAVGFVAFGVAISLVGVGALLAATALTLIAGVLPTVVQYGASGAVAIGQLSLGMIAFAAGAALAGAGCVVLGVGLAVVAVGLALVGAAVLITAAGVLLLAAGTVILGAGMMVTAAALTLAAAVLPTVATGALAGAAAFTLMLAMSLALMASLTLLNVPLVLVGATFLVASAGAAAFALAMTAGAVGVLAMAAALLAVNSNMKSIASNAKSAKNSITSMVSSVDVVNSGLDALGSKAKSAVNSVVNAFSSGASKARSSGTAMANGIKSGIQSGLASLPPLASLTMAAFNAALSLGGNAAAATSRSTSSAIVSALRSASSGSYSSGYNIGVGLANGMRACLGMVRSVASQLASAAEAAIRAKAKIHSPSKVSTKLGGFWGGGYAGGIADKAKEVWKQAENLVQIPSIVSAQSPEVAFAGGGSASLSEDYKYSDNATYTIIVPLNLEGREIAKASAVYTKEELDKLEKRNNRKQGYR